MFEFALKRFCVLGMVGFLALLAVSCGSKGGGADNLSDASVSLFLGRLDIPMFDSICVVVSAGDMDSIMVAESSASDNLSIHGIPQGESRKFEVKIYADNGKLVQKGEATADITAGESIKIPVRLKALAGFLRLEVPLGIPNNTGVSSGKLFLDSFEYSMKIENGKGVFNTNSLPLDKVFALRVELYSARSNILFTGSMNLSLSSISQTETMQLESATGSALLELQASLDWPARIAATLPASAYGRRKPQNYGDLFFTEIYANPSEGDLFQYMEIYNITLDTLELSSCKIARDDSDSPTGGKIILPEAFYALPMSYFVLGRRDVEDANYNYGSYALLKTGQSLGLFCDGLPIDTLAYSNKGENAFPLEKGKAMQLPIENYGARAFGASWCFGFSPGAEAQCL